MSVDNWKHRNYKSFQIRKKGSNYIEKMFKPGFTSDNVSWVSPYTRAPSNVVLRCSTSLQIMKRIVIDMYLFLSLKEVQGNASWSEQKKSGDAYRQSDKRIEFIVISALLYPGQVHKCTGVCTKDTAKNKWIPSLIVKCQNALHQNALRSLNVLCLFETLQGEDSSNSPGW